VTKKIENKTSLPNLLKCPLLTEYRDIHHVFTGKQTGYLVNIQLQHGKTKEEILDYFDSIDVFEKEKIEEIIESSKNASKVGMQSQIGCSQLRNAFGYTEDDCRTTDCKCKPEDDKDENETESCLIKLKYPTNHLLGFDDLSAATELSGKEYIVIEKALWYSLMSYQIRESQLKTGNVRPDCRVHLLLPIKTGHGKSNIKHVIKNFVEKMDGKYGEPTSLYSEQLIGKIVKVKDELLERPGYLADDYFVVDEAYQLLKSTDARYTESRSYLRTALDTYPDKNTVHKRMTEFGRERFLEFNPNCPAAIFLQPFRMDDDILVTEGDVRRFLIPYVNLTGVNKDEAFKERLLNNVDSASLNNFISQIKVLNIPEEFTMAYVIRIRFLELFFYLKNRGMNYSDKIRNFTDTIGHTLMNWLMKLSAIQAFQHHRTRIDIEDVELAYIDLFEFMEHEYQYVSDKIPGFLDYGEMWLGATNHDQTMLKWLYDRGAISLEDSEISIREYQEWIMDEFMVEDKQARRITKKHRDNGWISTKQGQHESFVWLAFDPYENSARSGWTSDMKTPQDSDSLEAQNEYYNLIKKYENRNMYSNLPVPILQNLPALSPMSTMTSLMKSAQIEKLTKNI